jgi:hypothetical protein
MGSREYEARGIWNFSHGYRIEVGQEIPKEGDAMTQTNATTGLPQPNIGMNPPRYGAWYARRTTKLITMTIAAFVAVGAVYLFFAV